MNWNKSFKLLLVKNEHGSVGGPVGDNKPFEPPSAAQRGVNHNAIMFEGLFKNTIYVKMKQDWLLVRLIETKREYQGKPVIAMDTRHSFIDRSIKVVAAGQEALRFKDSTDTHIKLANGFSHSRIVISDFAVAHATIRYFVSKLMNRSAILRPVIILHSLEIVGRGISQDEIKMLIDVGIAAGARRAMVWTGRELSDYEIENQLFPAGDGNLFESDSSKGIKELTKRSNRR